MFMKKIAFVVAFIALSASASANELVRKETVVDDKVSVTCAVVRVADLQPAPKYNDHIPQGTDSQGMAFIRDGKAYFCNPVVKIN